MFLVPGWQGVCDRHDDRCTEGGGGQRTATRLRGLKPLLLPEMNRMGLFQPSPGCPQRTADFDAFPEAKEVEGPEGLEKRQHMKAVGEVL